jgi:hypothetical protein
VSQPHVKTHPRGCTRLNFETMKPGPISWHAGYTGAGGRKMCIPDHEFKFYSHSLDTTVEILLKILKAKR